MSSKPASDPYQRLYGETRFEREGLFELIQEQFHPVEVLYPGCGMHLTPAFFFPHVVFIDQHPEAAAFFSELAPIRDLVERQRRYRRRSYLRFIHQDYTQPLPLRTNQYDLLLALYAGGISRTCADYLKDGGLLLSNNHRGDALEASRTAELSMAALVRFRKGKYRLEALDPEKPPSIPETGQASRYLRNTSRGVEYVDDETYYLFRKTQSSV